MSARVVTSAVAVVMVVGFIALAVLGGGSGGGPRPLPVLDAPGGGGERAASESNGPAPIDHRVEGELDELDGNAQAWSVGRAADLDRIAALAEAVGLEGEVAETATGWQAVGDDGRLDVQRQPGLPWSFDGGQMCGWTGGAPQVELSSKPEGGPGSTGAVCVVDPVVGEPAPGAASGGAEGERLDCDMPDCAPGAACVQVCPPNGADGGGSEPVPPPEPAVPAGRPTDDEARETALGMLTAIGVDVDGAEIEFQELSVGWSISVDPTVGGLPTVGLGSSVTIGTDGSIASATGWLADPAPGDRYPLVGTTAALDRLGDRHGGAPAGAEPDIGCDDCPVGEAMVFTGVRLGLKHVAAPGADEAWLVPTYLLAMGGGRVGEHPVPAVADEHRVEGPPIEVPDGCELVGGDAVSCPDEPVGPDGPGAPDRPVPTEPPVPGSGACHMAERETLRLEVCVSPTDPSPGDQVTFEVRATDSAQAIADDCASPLFSPDVGPGAGSCDIGFAPEPGAGPAEVGQLYTHVYDQPGDHRATISINGSCMETCRPLDLIIPVAVSP